MEKAYQERAKGLLLVPDWPESECISSVDREDGVRIKLLGYKSMSCESASWINSDTFGGRPAFTMRVYKFL